MKSNNIVNSDRSYGRAIQRAVRIDPVTVTGTKIQAPDESTQQKPVDKSKTILNNEGFDPLVKPSVSLKKTALEKKVIKEKMNTQELYDKVENDSTVKERATNTYDLGKRSYKDMDVEGQSEYTSKDTTTKTIAEEFEESAQKMEDTGGDIGGAKMKVTDGLEMTYGQMNSNKKKNYDVVSNDPISKLSVPDDYENLPEVKRRKTRASTAANETLDKVGKTMQRMPIGIGARKRYGTNKSEVIDTRYNDHMRNSMINITRDTMRHVPSINKNPQKPPTYSNPLTRTVQSQRSMMLNLPITRATTRLPTDPKLVLTRRTYGSNRRFM